MTSTVRRAILWVSALGVVALAHPVAAQIVDEEGVGRLTIGGGIGMGLTSMSDINQNIGVANPFFVREEVREMDKVNTGLLTGLDVRFKFGQTPLVPDEDGEVEGTVSFFKRLAVGFTWGAVTSESGFDVARATARFHSRATTYYPYVLWYAPWTEASLPRLSLYMGGGPLFLRGGSVEWAVGDSTSNNFIDEGDLSEISGQSRGTLSGTGAILQIGSAYQLNGRFSVAVDAGYRMANTSVTLNTASGQDKRFTGEDDIDTIRRPGDWSVIDFFQRRPDGEFDGRKRTDAEKEDGTGGCPDCPLYYTGDPIDVDFSGIFATLTFRVHF